ncbi:hypothetical protein [Pleurocapsa sp. FMAR1]|uniref:hypothetical protein n=1 Tax=Pleurocapsa sp. FMAR1 TaxID=3040204 RepID=UPI0029C90073|nr:hypothetical protein [Pleurocapsa sp. FMAR1]
MELTELEAINCYNALAVYATREFEAFEYFQNKYPENDTFFKKHKKTLPKWIGNQKAMYTAQFKILSSLKPKKWIKKHTVQIASNLAELDLLEHDMSVLLAATSDETTRCD